VLENTLNLINPSVNDTMLNDMIQDYLQWPKERTMIQMSVMKKEKQKVLHAIQ